MGSGHGGSDEFLTMLGAVDPVPLTATPAGEFLVNQLEDFEPDAYLNPVELSDNANKLLMLILAAVIKAGQDKEHGILSEIRGAVFVFLKKLVGLNVLDPALVSRVRILYIRMLHNCSPELANVPVRSVESFLEGGSGYTWKKAAASSGLPSPGREYQSLCDDDRQQTRCEKFRVDYKPARRITFKSIWRRLKNQTGASEKSNGDQSNWEQRNSMVKLDRLVKLSDQARNFAIGNKQLGALMAHSQSSDLLRQIQNWICHGFDLKLCSSAPDDGRGMYSCDAELLATAIYDGWLTGLGIPERLKAGMVPGSGTDALGQLLWDYTKTVYSERQKRRKPDDSPRRGKPPLPMSRSPPASVSVTDSQKGSRTPATRRQAQYGSPIPV